MIVGKSCSSWLFINTDKGLGADVGHPGPGVAKPSVTGLVFSYDEAATRYAALTDIQRPRVEIIESLDRMMEKSLRHFIELRKIPPRRVIFFRDGVSEGEYNTVATAELAAIQGTLMSVTFCLTYRTFSFFLLAAIQTIVGGRDYQILVTFIIVGKRYVFLFIGVSILTNTAFDLLATTQFFFLVTTSQ